MYHIQRDSLQHLTAEEIERVLTAERYAHQAHEGQVRAEGLPFVTHVIAAAELVAYWGGDCETIIATLLHDVVEDTIFDLDNIRRNFGAHVAYLVDGATKVIGKSKEESGKRTREKILSFYETDKRVAYIKLADRIHNLSTITSLRDEQILRIYRESETFYRTLAESLGNEVIQQSLERQLEKLGPKIAEIALASSRE